MPWLGAKSGEEHLHVRVRAREVELEEGDRLLIASPPVADLERFDSLRSMVAHRSVEDAAHELGCALAAQQATPELALAIAEWNRPNGPQGTTHPLGDDQISSDLGDLADLIRDVIDEYDAGTTPRYIDRTEAPSEARLSDDVSEEPAETYDLDDAETEAPLRRVVSAPSAPSMPTLDTPPSADRSAPPGREGPTTASKPAPLLLVAGAAALVLIAVFAAYLLA